jgi:hypothetical protein
MSTDVIALCARMPDPGTVLAALRAAGPDLRIDAAEPGSLIQLCAEDGAVLVSIESPRLVQVPGEAERLLGIPGPLPHPLWWVETRARPAGAAVARRYAAALVSVTGGTTWQSR